MTYDEIIDAMLYRDEGKSYVAYPDPLTKADPWTIGRGHTGPEVCDLLVWNDDQIEDAYQLDKSHAWQGCVDNLPWFGALCPERQAVLVAMAFQMGIHGLLEFQQTLASVRDGHYANAAEGMRQSAWGKETPQRVNRMALQMESGALQ